MVDPSKIQTKEDAIRELQKLRNNGLPPDIINKVNSYIDSPVANTAMNLLGINKSDFKNGLQAITRSDLPSTSTSYSALLQGIDQLK